MRLLVFAATAIVVMAALITLSGNQQPLSRPSAVASTVLVAALAIQRISGIQRWLSAPKNRRREQVDSLAQQTLINLCRGSILNGAMLELRVHVWEVPLWYRRILPYWLRRRFKIATTKRGFRLLARFTIRPTLNRLAAAGLYKAPPTGVRFRKGLGIVGVCLANNDRAEFLTLSTQERTYRQALRAPDEATWAAFGNKVTHGLTREDAIKLSHSYGQVLARVVQDLETGEAIGCATISVKDTDPSAPQVVTAAQFKAELSALALGVATIVM